MRVVRETDVGDAGDGHQNGRAEQREAARPPAGIPVPALAEDVIQRRTSKSTVTCRHHDTSGRPPRPSWSWRFRFRPDDREEVFRLRRQPAAADGAIEWTTSP